MTNTQALAHTLWKCLGKLLAILELCVQGNFLNTSAIPHRCPHVCICTLDLLSCAKQGLQQVPVALPPTATTLDLSHNALFQLHNHWLAALPRLQALRINHNRIIDLLPQAFHNATDLRHLDMSSNYLHAIEKHYFEAL
ncbi:unnamed protein product [Lepidochelys kempii]